MPRPEESEGFEPLLPVNGSDFGALLVFLDPVVLLLAGLLDAVLGFEVLIPKSNDGLSDFSVGFDGC